MNKYARPENFDHSVRTPLLRQHYVYRTFNAAGELLYVGCSLRPETRMREHRFSSQDWYREATRYTLSGPHNYETARELEREAIYTERPLFNYTPERRQIAVSHSKIISREIERLIAHGVGWGEAFRLACDVADLLVPYAGNRGAMRIQDGQALAAKAAERAHRQVVAA